MRFAAAVGCGGVKTPPYDAKDKRVLPARLRAGHARPLRTAVKIYAREGQGRAAARPFVVDGWLAGNGGGHIKPVKAPQAGLRGQLPTAWGAFCAGGAREKSLPIRGGGREAGRKGSAC